MKNKFLVVFFNFIFLFSLSIFAKENKDDLIAKDFPGWKVFSFVEGSLHNKKSRDLVMILVKKEFKMELFESGDNVPDDLMQTLLVIYLENENHKLEFHTKSEKAICMDCGGAKAWPGPLGGLSVSKNGLLVVDYMYGSRELNSQIFKWRLDAKTNKFLLIGETYTEEDTLGEDPTTFIDINYLSLKAEKKIGKKPKINCAVDARFKRIELDSFEIDFGTRAHKIAESCQ